MTGAMSDDTGTAKPQKAGRTTNAAREARLKAALKSNMARRKAQAKARSGQNESEADPETGQDKE
jgi:hypothetical protein